MLHHCLYHNLHHVNKNSVLYGYTVLHRSRWFRNNSHPDSFHPENFHPGQFPFRTFPTRTVVTVRCREIWERDSTGQHYSWVDLEEGADPGMFEGVGNDREAQMHYDGETQVCMHGVQGGAPGEGAWGILPTSQNISYFKRKSGFSNSLKKYFMLYQMWC